MADYVFTKTFASKEPSWGFSESVLFFSHLHFWLPAVLMGPVVDVVPESGLMPSAISEKCN
jgi:hypothetical protein